MDTNCKFEETIKKSELPEVTRFDLEKLSAAGEHFLDMTWREEGDDIIFCYDRAGLLPFDEVGKEDFVTVMNLLILAAKFEEDAKRYRFSLSPGNLFFHPCGRIYLQSRGLWDENEDIFPEKYRALCGWALSGKYTYSDYLEGGEDLYAKHEPTKRLQEKGSVEEIVRFLEEYRAGYIEKRKKEKISVSRFRFRILRIVFPILAVWAVAASVYGGKQYFDTLPYLQAVNQAGNAYIENNYDDLIEALQKFSVQELDIHQKYILALAYLQSESLSEEQRQNAAKNVSVKSDERYLDYWIHIGRLDAKQAEETAMSLMDDELLLYAYLLDKELTQADEELSGEEKQQRLKEIQSGIDEITKNYGLEE